MTFAKKLKELRTKAGLSQSGLAEKSGMSLSAVHDYEQGKREPSLKSAAKLAVALDTDCRAFAECVLQEDEDALPKKPGRRTRKGK